MPLGVVALSAAVLGSGCASTQYRYEPAEHQLSSRSQRNEALYSEPAKAPSGLVRIFSLGVADVRPTGGGEKTPAVHLHLAITNSSSSQSWTLNTREQTVSFPNHGQAQPMLATSDAKEVTALTIKPGELGTVDLYFPLPPHQKSADDLPAFDFRWSLLAGSESVRETTLFDRVEIPESPVILYPFDYYPYHGGWGWFGYRFP